MMTLKAWIQQIVASHPWALSASLVIVAGTVAYLSSPHYKVCPAMSCMLAYQLVGSFVIFRQWEVHHGHS
jgi:hypothetical protein